MVATPGVTVVYWQGFHLAMTTELGIGHHLEIARKCSSG